VTYDNLELAARDRVCDALDCLRPVARAAHERVEASRATSRGAGVPEEMGGGHMVGQPDFGKYGALIRALQLDQDDQEYCPLCGAHPFEQGEAPEDEENYQAARELERIVREVK